jgi:hypothetical protein
MADTALKSRPDADEDADRASTGARPGAMPTGGDRQPPSIKTTNSNARYGNAMRVDSGSGGSGQAFNNPVSDDAARAEVLRNGGGRLDSNPVSDQASAAAEAAYQRQIGGGVRGNNPVGDDAAMDEALRNGGYQRGNNPVSDDAARAEVLRNGGGRLDSNGLYKKAGLNEEEAGVGGNRLTAAFKGISRRKKLGAAGGVGGIMGLLVAVALITPIYRIPALLTDVGDKVGAEVDHVVEKRAERIVVNYLIRKAGGNATDYVVTGSPLSDLWRTFQSHRIENKIADKTGITFKKVGNIVRVFHDGRDLGGVRNYDEVAKIIERGTIKNRKDFNTIIKTVVPAVRFHKASIEAKSFKSRFLKGSRFGAPKEVENKSGDGSQLVEDTEKTVAALTEQQIDEGIAGSIGELGDALSCVMDDTACDTFKEADPDAAVPDPNSEAAQRDIANGSSKEVTDEINEASGEAKTEAIKDREGGFVARILEKVLTKVIGAVAAKLVTKAIPYVGWVDLAADLQHAFGTAFANDLPHRIPILLKENAYGAIFAAWAGYADQQKAGRMPNSQGTALAKQAGGAEKAVTYHYLYNKGTTNVGTPVKPLVGSNTYSELDNAIDDVYNNLGVRITVRGPLELWYYTVGKLLKLFGDWGNQGVTWLMNITGFTALANSTLKSIFGDNWKEELGKFAVKVITNLFGIAIDPLAKGAELFNNIFTGAAVAFNYECHFNLGCRVLSPPEGIKVGMVLQQEQDENMQMTSVKDRLFDPNTPNSLAGTLMRDAPSDPKADTIVSSLFGMAAKLPSSIAGAFSPKLRAAPTDDMSSLTGTLWYGADDDTDLNQDTAPQLRTQTGTVSCPRTDPLKQFNVCDADQTVINSVKCQYSDCPEFTNN